MFYLSESSPQLEVSRYNALIGLVRGALADLAGALKGSIIMSLEIEDTLEAVRKASIPLPWLLQVNLKKKNKLQKRVVLLAFIYLTFCFAGLPQRPHSSILHQESGSKSEVLQRMD